MIIGESLKLHIKHYPEHLPAPKISKWESSDLFVASASFGELKAKSEGEALITATTENNISATCRVIVGAIEITEIKIGKANYEIPMGETLQLTPKVSPEDASYKNNLVYTSTNENVAKIGRDGKIETVNVGECQIKVASPDGKESTTCNIKVLSIAFDKTQFEDIIGKQLQLQVSNVSEIYKDKLTYSSTNDAVAKVNAEGLVETVGVGECVVSASSTDGKVKAECKVKVLPSEVSAISLNQSDLTLMQSELYKFETSIEPIFAADKTVTWTSSDENTATISADGTLTALAIGECTITAHSSNAEVTAQCNVKVIAATPKEVNLNKLSLELMVGAIDNLSATIYPTAANQNVSWTSSDPNIVAIENGMVTAISVGTATITATSEEGGQQQSCVVTVEGVDKYISAQNGNVVTTFTNFGVYTYVSCQITNKSNVDVYVKSIIIDGRTTSVGETLKSNYKISNTYYTNSAEKVVWIIEYNGVEYEVNSFWNPSYGGFAF